MFILTRTFVSNNNKMIRIKKTYKIILQTYFYRVILILVLFERVKQLKKRIRKAVDIEVQDVLN